MHCARKINDSLWSIGAGDRRLEQFENMFILPEGICYNSYLLLDEKTCLIDAVDLSVSEQYYNNVAAVLGDRDLDYFVVNHVEPDHCGTIDGIMLRYPNCKLLVSALGAKLTAQFYHHEYGDRVQTVEEGHVLDLGQHKLETITAPHVHWPEVTFTYEQTEGWLFSADAFGSFKAPEGHIFADQVNYERDWLPEARRYYVNIVGRHGAMVQKVFPKLAGRKINMILSVHGLIFRTPQTIEMIIDKYQHWSTYTAEEKGVVIVYGSMYGNSAQLADELAYQLSVLGVENIRVYDVSKTEYSFITADCFRFSNAVFICNNYNTELYPKMKAFLDELMHLNYDNHKVSLCANMSWGGKALKMAQDTLAVAKKMEIVGAPVQIKSNMTAAEEPKLIDLAKAIHDSMDAFQA